MVRKGISVEVFVYSLQRRSRGGLQMESKPKYVLARISELDVLEELTYTEGGITHS